ncbi:major facilitator superfamily transporter [Xylariaceae sp. FL1019]|nr:major facilitator superfamily transporter [Xylariaceae sp. FL1019]
MGSSANEFDTSNAHFANKNASDVDPLDSSLAVNGTSTGALQEWQPSKHEKAIFYTLSLLNLVVALDATVIVTSLNAIVEDIGGTTTEAFWIGTSYLLANAVSMPLYCSISDVIGRSICLTASIVLFTVGTIVCSTSREVASMLVGRTIQGVGGGGIHSLALVILTDIVPLRWRPKWYGIILASWALGLSSGPIIGAGIAERTTWRWIFYLMFFILGPSLLLTPYLLTLRPPQATAQEKLSRIDWIGLFIFTGSVTSFLIAISWAGTQHAWDSASVLVPLIIGVVGTVVAIFYEMRFAKHPFLEKDLFRDTSSTVTYVAAALQGFMLYGTLYYVPLFFISVKNYSIIDSGVALLPNLLPFSISGIIIGRLVTRFNSFRWAIWAGWFFSAVGTAFYTVWHVNSSKPVWVIGLFIGGTSHGAILTAQNFATQAMCRDGSEGAAAAMYIFFRQFGIALGVGIGATIFQNALKMKLLWSGLPANIAYEANTYIPILHSLPDGPMKDAITDAYSFGFQIIFATWLGISIVTLLFSVVFIRHADMNRKLATEHRLDSERVNRHWNKERQADEAATELQGAVPSR